MTSEARRRLREIGVFVFAASDHGRHGYVVQDSSASMWFPTLEEAEELLRLAGLL